jgi:hypothetical protein
MLETGAKESLRDDGQISVRACPETSHPGLLGRAHSLCDSHECFMEPAANGHVYFGGVFVARTVAIHRNTVATDKPGRNLEHLTAA